MNNIRFVAAALALWASLVRAGQFISTFNLVTPQQLIASQTYSPGVFGLVSSLNQFPQPGLQGEVLAHPAVVENSIAESNLPRELTKSRNFYENPYVASALAKESLSLNKEALTYDRPSEKIPRQEIVKLINNLYRVHHETK